MRCSIESRELALSAARFNTALIPADQVPVDLSSPAITGSHTSRVISANSVYHELVEVVRLIFGYSFCFPVHLGRGAEAIIATQVKQGQVVVANEVYLTSQWSIRRNGGEVCSIINPVDKNFSGNLDTDALEARLKSNSVAYVQVTAPLCLMSEYGGRPVSLKNLRTVRSLIDQLSPKLPLVLDASRIFENAAWIKLKEEGCNHARIIEIVRDLTACADIIFLSGRKDLAVSAGGILAINGDTKLSKQMIEIAELFEGSTRTGGLSSAEISDMTASLMSFAEHETIVADVQRLETLAQHLIYMGVPVASWGAGALYLDARAWLPKIPVKQSPAQTLVNAFYLYAGIRGIGTAAMDMSSKQFVRLCVTEKVFEYLKVRLPLLATQLHDRTSGFNRLPERNRAPFLDALQPTCPDDWCSQPPFQEPEVHIACGSGFSNFAWPKLESAFRKKLKLIDNQMLVPAHRERGPQRLLMEIARLHEPPLMIETKDLVVQRLTTYFRRQPLFRSSSITLTMHVVTRLELGEALKKKLDGDVIALDLGRIDSWQSGQSPGSVLKHKVDIIWACDPLSDQAGGGFLAFRPNSSLYQVLRDVMLFSVGSIHDGGLSGVAMTQLASALE